MNEKTSHTLRGPENEEERRVYHEIRRKVLFESRGRVGVYNENHPDEFEEEQFRYCSLYLTNRVSLLLAHV